MNITVTIAGIDRTALVTFGSLRINDVINNKTDDLSFEIKKYGTVKNFKPLPGQEVIVLDGADEIFGGVIITVEESIDAANVLYYDVTAKDYSQYLDRALVLDRYENTTVQDIITSMVAEYAPTFTTNHVTAFQNVASISFNRIPLSQAIDRLARLVNYSWYIDNDKDIHFFAKNTELAPFNLTDTSANYVFDSLSVTGDISQIRNRVTVTGGEEVSNPRTVYGDADGQNKQWDTIYKFSSIPTVYISGIEKTVGLEGIDDELDFDFLWSFTGRYIRSATAYADGVATIAMMGTPYLPVVVQVDDSDSILQYGIYEHTISNPSVKTRLEAINLALADLEAYANQVNEGEFITNYAGLKSGQVININSTLRGIDEDFIIQKVTFRMISNNVGEYRVTIATLRTLSMIDFLQGLLQNNNEIRENEAEGLLSFITLEDLATASDSLTMLPPTSPPYFWVGPTTFSTLTADTGITTFASAGTKTFNDMYNAKGSSNPIRWNFFTWAG